LAKQIGIDVGGTFTDLFMLDDATGAVRIAKTPTTTNDLREGLMNGLRDLEVAAGEVGHLIHGTTIATNAVIERKGSVCGLITTHGFRDVLEMGRRDRPHFYGMYGLQQPLVPRNLRLEVRERLLASGEVLQALEESDVREAVQRFAQAGISAVSVCLLHAYANPVHERRVRDIIRSMQPDWLVNLSSDLLPEIYEFERTSTTVIHTYLHRLVDNYIQSLKQRLGQAGYTKDVLFVQSNGGVVSSKSVRDRPANLVLSGPAAGVMAAQSIARRAGFTNIISGDMGGTSFDVCLIPGTARTTEQTNLAFRQPLRVSMIDVHAIGAGGGSIARVDERGLLQVGPQSAGSVPGPVAYGRGGTSPTITDAQIVLGRIASGQSIAGGRELDGAAAAAAIQRQVAGPLGVTVPEAAHAIIQIANSSMAGRIRLISVEKGYDPRDFALVAYGGAGPLHAVGLMREVGIGRCLIPVNPGVLCAMGCITSNVQHDLVRTIMRRLSDIQPTQIRDRHDEMAAEGAALLARDDIPLERTEVRVTAEMSYEGQRNTIRVPVAGGHLDPVAVQAAFEEAYRREYKNTLPGLPIFVNVLRVTVVGIRPQLPVQPWPVRSGALDQAQVAQRPVYFGDTYITTRIYDRARLPVGVRISGPAIIQQLDCTTVIDPGFAGVVDDSGNIIVEKEQGS
jgi:N-methylhydantoinase A